MLATASTSKIDIQSYFTPCVNRITERIDLLLRPEILHVTRYRQRKFNIKPNTVLCVCVCFCCFVAFSVKILTTFPFILKLIIRALMVGLFL